MATIKEVAKHAGLSVTTVSRYLNNHPYISDEKKEKIQKAMEALDYTPNAAATQLRSNKSYTIGIIVSRITNPYFSYLIDAIEQVVKPTPYHTLILQTYDDPKEEVRLLDMLKQRTIDGIIMCSIENDISLIKQYKQYGPIVVTGDISLKKSGLPVVATDQEEATYLAIKYLLDKGYTEIGYCTGGIFSKSKHGSSRKNGFIKALNEHHIELNDSRIYNNVHTIDDGFKLGRSILNSPKNEWPEVIFTSSDEVAISLIHTFIEAGVKVPGDIAVMGYDNQPLTSMIQVPLTTVSQPVQAIGEEAVHLLISLLNEESYEVNEDRLMLEIVERKSV
ncbi:LacI family DNA-binding transcriptional regulator [Corticicoccus populi]|uniref:LacI family DNA-binding transcriptional regulator n=1 Tax=Corticicoccus populi TaxID=1812821 RepID=A0ABW5WYF1_9STAP